MTKIITDPTTQAKIEIPYGKNDLSVDKLFHERKIYSSLLPDDMLKYTVDMRLQSNLYGKVDKNLNAVFPDPKKITLDVENQVITFDFVRELYEDFKWDWDSRCVNSVPSNSMYQGISFFSDYRDIGGVLFERYGNILKKFLLFTTNEYISDRIVNFQIFLDEFLNYLRVKDLIFSREQFIKSKFYKNEHSMLVFDFFEEGTFENDEENFRLFYLDGGIDIFAQTLIRHGFLLDRFAPWRALINLNSPQVRTREKTIDTLAGALTRAEKGDLARKSKASIDSAIDCKQLLSVFKAFSKEEADKLWKGVHMNNFLDGKWKKFNCSKPPFEKAFDEKSSQSNSSPLPIPGGAKQVFDNYFVVSYKTELSFLKIALFGLYNLYIDDVQKSTLKHCENTGKPITAMIKRKKVELEKISDVQIFKFYMKLRIHEARKSEKAHVAKRIDKISNKPPHLPAALELLQAYTKTPRQYSKFDNEIDALEFANKLGCKGSHVIDKKFYPCEDHKTYLSLTKPK